MYARQQIAFAAGLAILLLTAGNSNAAETRWTASSGNWSGGGNWNNGVPGATDTAIFDSGSAAVTIDVDVVIGSLVITNCTRTIGFKQGDAVGMEIGGDLYLGSGATILCRYVSTGGEGTGRVITVSGNATVKGTISADGQGFPTAKGPGYAGNNPGGTHGGQGGRSTAAVYGSLAGPSALGSGGFDAWGGGAISLIVGGGLNLDGTIRADGATAYWTGGAGGSVWVRSDAFGGNGTIRANGGRRDDNSKQPGGGGRLCVEYKSSSFTGSLLVNGNTAATTPSRPGSISVLELPPFSSIESHYSVTGNNNGVRITRVMQTSGHPRRLRWVEESTYVASSNQLDNVVTYTLTGLTPDMEYLVFVDDVLVFTGDSDENGRLTGVSVSLAGGPRTILLQPNPPRGTVMIFR